MTDIRPPAVLAEARAQFDRLVRDIREDLYRYCARMTGSAVDGEDVMQEVLAKAYYQLAQTEQVADLRAWLFRIAHNKAIDFLRRYDRRFGEVLHDDLADEVEAQPVEAEEVARLTLSHYLTLTALQRSCVLLKDVMDYSLAEISETLDLSVPAVKGALHRGRSALRERAQQVRAGQPAALDVEQKQLLSEYVERFNARDFDTLRDWLADDARLEVVNRQRVRGAAGVGSYFGNYERIDGWRFVAGTIDGRPAVLGFDGPALRRLADASPNTPTAVSAPSDGPPGATFDNPPRPTFVVLLEWRGQEIAAIRDYRYARHVTELADFELMD